jgi:hypothetical protein
MRENVLPLLESYGVDLVLSGHSHSYERSFLIDGHYGTSLELDSPSMVLDPGNGWPFPEAGATGPYTKDYSESFLNKGAVYAVAGTGGQVSPAELNHPAMHISLAELGSMVIDVYGDTLDGTFLGADGVIKDHFTLIHTPKTYPPTILWAKAHDETTVELRFTETLDALFAQTLANYSINGGLTLNAVALSADFRSVMLSLSPMTPGTQYTVTVSGVKGVRPGSTIPLPGIQALFRFFPGPTVIESRVAASADDAEESTHGSVSLGSSDLEMVFDGSDQIVGMRFNEVAIPSCSAITKAYVQFHGDEVNLGDTTLAVQGESSVNPSVFTTSRQDISNRPRTFASVPWSPFPWSIVGQAGLDHRTPDLSSIVQEIIDLPDWSAGTGSLAILITGTGERTAVSFDGDANAAPLLHVEYLDTSNPLVIIDTPGNGSIFTVGQNISFSATADDCADGNLDAALSWTSSLDGPLNGGTPAASFSTTELSAGTHVTVGPVTDIDPAANEVSEDAPLGAATGVTAHAIDPDAGDSVSYAFSNGSQTSAGGVFSIDAASGAITLAAALARSPWRRRSTTTRRRAMPSTCAPPRPTPRSAKPPSPSTSLR